LPIRGGPRNLIASIAAVFLSSIDAPVSKFLDHLRSSPQGSAPRQVWLWALIGFALAGLLGLAIALTAAAPTAARQAVAVRSAGSAPLASGFASRRAACRRRHHRGEPRRCRRHPGRLTATSPTTDGGGSGTGSAPDPGPPSTPTPAPAPGPLDITPPKFAGLQSAFACTPGPQSPGETTPFNLSWEAATDDVTPSSLIVYDVYLATTSGGEDFSQPTWVTPPGVTGFQTPGLPSHGSFYFVIRARDQAGNEDANTVEVHGSDPCL
jgi:hypothetical protein